MSGLFWVWLAEAEAMHLGSSVRSPYLNLIQNKFTTRKKKSIPPFSLLHTQYCVPRRIPVLDVCTTPPCLEPIETCEAISEIRLGYKVPWPPPSGILNFPPQ